MKINSPNMVSLQNEAELFEVILPLEHSTIIELGCGSAINTRGIARKYPTASILACDVDRVENQKNSNSNTLPNLTFIYGEAQAVPEPNESADIVLMFKSFHHVPKKQMEKALLEILRVLRPGGLAYISEPIFSGNFNEVLRLFHDEREVREAAYSKIKKVVESKKFELVDQYFFQLPRQFENFDDFKSKIIDVTHTEHNIDEEKLETIKAKYKEYETLGGAALFKSPMRVDLLRKPINPIKI